MIATSFHLEFDHIKNYDKNGEGNFRLTAHNWYSKDKIIKKEEFIKLLKTNLHKTKVQKKEIEEVEYVTVYEVVM